MLVYLSMSVEVVDSDSHAIYLLVVFDVIFGFRGILLVCKGEQRNASYWHTFFSTSVAPCAFTNVFGEVFFDLGGLPPVFESVIAVNVPVN